MKTRALALALAAAALLAGCSRPGSSPASTALTLGGGLALTGNASLLGQDLRLGLELAQEHFGAQNPRLQLLLEDTGSDEAGATQAFRRLINAGVVAIVGPAISQQGFAVFPMAERAGVPAIGASTTAVGIPQLGGFVARVSAPVTAIAPRSLAKALSLDPAIRRVAVFYAQDDAFASSESQVFQQAIRARGLQLVSVQRTSISDSDFHKAISDVLSQKPQLIVISALASDGGNLVRQLREMKYSGTIVAGNGLNTPNVFAVCQRYCDGVLIAQAYNPELNSPINAVLLDLYRRRQPGSSPPQFTAQAFTGYQVVHQALQQVQQELPPGRSLNQLPRAELRRRLMAALLAGSYQTPLGPLRFSPEGEVIQQQFSVGRIRMAGNGRNGRFEMVP
jgi:branched-chain amino acid transport system substrate-binding protein